MNKILPPEFDKAFVHADEILKPCPCSLENMGMMFFIDEVVYDLGYGVVLNANDCLKLIEWWNNGGKEEYL